MSAHREPATTALPGDAFEDSGSFTGVLLSYGQVELPGRRSRLAVVVLVLALVVAVMAIIGLVAAVATGDLVTGWFDRMFSG